MTRRISPRALLPFLVLSALIACGGGGGGDGLGGGGGGGDTGPGGGGGGDTPEARQFIASLPAISGELAAFAEPGTNFPLSFVVVQSDGTRGEVRGPIPNVNLQLNADGSGNISSGTTTFVFDEASGLYRATNLPGTFARLALSRDVGAILFGGSDEGLGIVRMGAFGRESTDVGVQSGTAIYIGPSAYLAVENATGAVTGGGGGFLLTADFDRAAVDGRIALSDAATTSPQFFLDFTGAPISGNGFATTSLRATGLNGTVTGSGLEATFYGPGARQVGGVYTVDIAGSGGTSQIGGVLIGDRQDLNVNDLIAAAAAGNTAIRIGGETIDLGSGPVIGGPGAVFPRGGPSYYSSTTGASFGADGAGCLFSGDWSTC